MPAILTAICLIVFVFGAPALGRLLKQRRIEALRRNREFDARYGRHEPAGEG